MLPDNPLDSAKLLQQTMTGALGAEVIADANVHTPPDGYVFAALQVLAAATLDTGTAAAADAPITGTITGIAFDKNAIIYGKFTAVELSGGTVLAYYGIA